MKNIAMFCTMAIALFVISTVQAQAGEVMLDTTIEQMTVQQDKNGNEYARLIIKEDRELNGVPYTIEVVTMVFGSDLVAKAQQLSPGDTIKAIATTNEYQGRTNYNVLAFVE